MANPAGFYIPWAMALAASTAEPAASSAATVLHFEGLNLPVVQAVLAVAGVLMARPLARKKESKLAWPQFLLVTAMMLVVALAWVAQSQPGVLFTFVVAIGLGFSGYALVETAGSEVEGFVKRIFAQVTDALGMGAKK